MMIMKQHFLLAIFVFVVFFFFIFVVAAGYRHRHRHFYYYYYLSDDASFVVVAGRIDAKLRCRASDEPKPKPN